MPRTPSPTQPHLPPPPARRPAPRTADAAADPPADAPATTVTRQSRERRPEPRLPHEHDQSVDSQHPAPGARATGEQALDDVSRGLVDTDEGRQAHRVLSGQPRPKS